MPEATSSSTGSAPSARTRTPSSTIRVRSGGLSAKPDIIDLHEEPFALATAQVLLLRRGAPRAVRALLGAEHRQALSDPVPLVRALGAPSRRRGVRLQLARRARSSPARACAGPARADPARSRHRAVPSGWPTRPRAALPSSATSGASSRTRACRRSCGPRRRARSGASPHRRRARSAPSWGARALSSASTDRVTLPRASPRETNSPSAIASSTCSPCRRSPGRAGSSSSAASRSRRWPRACPWSPVARVRFPTSSADAGILVEPGDPDALRDGIDGARVDAVGRRCETAGLVRADDFTWERVAEQHLALYRAVVPSHDAGAARAAARRRGRIRRPRLFSTGARGARRGVRRHDRRQLVVEATRGPWPRAHGAHYVDPGAQPRASAPASTSHCDSLADRGCAIDDVLLLNPDARIAPEGVRAHAAHRCTRIVRLAAVGATQTDPETRRRRSVCGGRSRRPRAAWTRGLGLGRFDRAHDFAIGSDPPPARGGDRRQSAEFDERFFLYAEETDWQKRARDRRLAHRRRRGRGDARRGAARAPTARVGRGCSSRASRTVPAQALRRDAGGRSSVRASIAGAAVRALAAAWRRAGCRPPASSRSSATARSPTPTDHLSRPSALLLGDFLVDRRVSGRRRGPRRVRPASARALAPRRRRSSRSVDERRDGPGDGGAVASMKHPFRRPTMNSSATPSGGRDDGQPAPPRPRASPSRTPRTSSGRRRRRPPGSSPRTRGRVACEDDTVTDAGSRRLSAEGGGIVAADDEQLGGRRAGRQGVDDRPPAPCGGTPCRRTAARRRRRCSREPHARARGGRRHPPAGSVRCPPRSE